MKISQIHLNDDGLPVPTAEVEQERKVAIFDLLDDNSFALTGKSGGPYELTLGIQDKLLVLETEDETKDKTSFGLSLTPFRQIIKDYFQICESYYDAVKKLPAAQIEAIDMGRRGIHDEGARLLLERLEGKIDTDTPTARRLFTLICVLQFKG